MKKHSSRLIGGTEIHSQGRDDVQQGGSWRTRGVRQQLVDWGGEVAVGGSGGTTFMCR